MSNNHTTHLSPDTNIESTSKSPDPNFTRAALHPSGASGEGITSGTPGKAAIMLNSTHSPDPNSAKDAKGLDRGFARAASHPSGTPGKAVTSRINSFDLARGFTVLAMPMIHVVMLYSTIPVQQSILGDILGFIAEGPGAQLFMLLMGVSFTFSKRIGKQYVYKRAFHLLIAAYLLNILKFIIPLAVGMMPDNVLAELQLHHKWQAAKFFFWMGDILHFAAIAYLVLFFITRFKYYSYIALIAAMAIVFGSPYVWDYQTGITAIDKVLVLFNGHPPQTFFPVLPWLVYPLIGLTGGYLLQHNHQNYILKKCGLTGIAIMLISFCFPATDNSSLITYLPFYRTQPADTVFHIGLVLVWLSLFHGLSKKIRSNPVFTLLIFCSKNITPIYMIQWILICWCLPITGYLQLNLTYSIIWMCCITINTLIIAYLIRLRTRPPTSIRV